MPRVVDLTVPPDRTEELVRRLTGHDEVLSVRLLPGASVSPPGDVLSFEVLDSSLAWAMRLADDAGLGTDPGVSLTTSRPESVASAGSQATVDRAWQSSSCGSASRRRPAARCCGGSSTSCSSSSAAAPSSS